MRDNSNRAQISILILGEHFNAFAAADRGKEIGLVNASHKYIITYRLMAVLGELW
jgi:hypothetical protein